MSRLNLDIFSEEEAKTTVQPENSGTKANLREASKPHSSPKFVPVGFHEAHLRALDEAVLALRRQGHWKASKSGIIRRLLDLHEGELVELYLRR